MLDKVKSIMFCSVAILLCLNFTACSNDSNKDYTNTETTKATTLELSHVDIELFCKVGLENAEVDALKMELEKHKSVNAYKLVTKEEQAKKAKEILGDEKIFEGEYSNILPISFLVKLNDISLIDSFYNEFKDDFRIDSVRKNNRQATQSK